MADYTVTLTDTENTAMEYIAADVDYWITNAATNRARIAIEEIIKINTIELLAFDAFIIVSLSSMLSAYFGASVTKKTEASNLNKIFSVFLILTAISILFY